MRLVPNSILDNSFYPSKDQNFRISKIINEQCNQFFLPVLDYSSTD